MTLFLLFFDIWDNYFLMIKEEMFVFYFNVEDLKIACSNPLGVGNKNVTIYLLVY
ncbi:hypothetical protein LX78_01372 [Xanthomarina spongicola]|uniref:Uncharacterized protein n=1 Tax=Xanthomarina spongicola TaxID=570520 RepID=A0A316DPL9_9FLAO|nr:hypothetical protein LX78_01372 [Xanthomarina spongicola]